MQQLKKIQMDFKPFWGLASPGLQTIIAAKLPSKKLAATISQLTLKDGDTLVFAQSKPVDWQPHMPSVIALHGLCGDHDSSYMRRLGVMAMKLGYRFIAVNFRGCGLGKGHAKGLYHAGRSDDVDTLIQHIHQHTPQSPLALVGFSLGGNVALKLAGEWAHKTRDYLKGVVAVTPPVDLAKCADMINYPANRIFRRYFISQLWKAVAERHRLFPELGKPPKANMSFGFWEFDDLYTSQHSGFIDAKDYYAKSSSLTVLADIAMPCKLLFAKDDPFIDYRVVSQTQLAAQTELVVTQHGGHMGFLAAPGKGRPLRWMDYKLIAWLQGFFNS